MTLLKYSFTFIIVFFVTNIVHSGDLIGSLIYGSRQDTLILGTVKTVKGDTLNIDVTYIFPQNKLWFLKTGDNIIVKKNFRKESISDNDRKIKNSIPTLHLPPEYKKEFTPPAPPAPGMKYLLSLNKETRWFSASFYYPAWGMYEVKGDKYSDMQLVNQQGFENKELQIFINSGGTFKDFKYDENNVLVLPEKKSDSK